MLLTGSKEAGLQTSASAVYSKIGNIFVPKMASGEDAICLSPKGQKLPEYSIPLWLLSKVTTPGYLPPKDQIGVCEPVLKPPSYIPRRLRKEERKETLTNPKETTTQSEAASPQRRGFTLAYSDSKDMSAIQDAIPPTGLTIDCFQRVARIDGNVYQVQLQGTDKYYAQKKLENISNDLSNLENGVVGGVGDMPVTAAAEVGKIGDKKDDMSRFSILVNLDHPNIVKLRYVFSDEENDRHFFIMDYVEGQTLFDFYQNFKGGIVPPAVAKNIVRQVVSAVAHIHSKGAIYRSLDEDKIIVSSDQQIVLLGFDFAKTVQKAATNTFVGTPIFMAPEALTGEAYTSAVDWWAVGILLYILLTGSSPWEPFPGAVELLMKINHTTIAYPDTLPEDAQDLLSKLLHRDVDLRLCDPQKILEHPFLA